MIVNGDSQGTLSVILTDDMLIQRSGDLRRLEQIEATAGRTALGLSRFSTVGKLPVNNGFTH